MKFPYNNAQIVYVADQLASSIIWMSTVKVEFFMKCTNVSLYFSLHNMIGYVSPLVSCSITDTSRTF